jgi:hypothetical protein
MSENSGRLAQVIAAIDAANARDPNNIEIDGRFEPAERVYGQRMSETLARMAPSSSAHLQIAARGQHIERWTSPRKSYPEGRADYLKWRKDLKEFHAKRVGEIMAAAGYGAEDIHRVSALVRKEQLKSDAETQMLEDVACVVFLDHYFGEFMGKIDPEKLPGILAKTWSKMSPLGQEQALKLNRPAVRALLDEVLARMQAAGAAQRPAAE